MSAPRYSKTAISIALVIGTATGAFAGHGTTHVPSYSGCLKGDGKIEHVAQGGAPQRACKAGEAQVHLSGGDVTAVGLLEGSGLTGGGSEGAVSLGTDPSILQRRVTGSCVGGQGSIATINEDGSVECSDDGTFRLWLADGGTASSFVDLGGLRLSAACGGPFGSLDVQATTATDHSYIRRVLVSPPAELARDGMGDFSVGDSFSILEGKGDGQQGWATFSTPTGPLVQVSFSSTHGGSPFGDGDPSKFCTFEGRATSSMP